MKSLLTILIVAFTLVTVKSQKSIMLKTEMDLGGGYVITTFLEYSKEGDAFKMTSPQNADKRLFGGVKSTLARTTGKIQKGGILVSIKGQAKNNSLIGEALVTGFGELDFKGKMIEGKLEGELYGKDGASFGTLIGAKTNETRMNYTSFYPKILNITQGNIYSKKVLETKEWKKFTRELEKLMGKAQDDIELFFGFNMLSQELPFSHYNLLFQQNSYNEELNEEETNKAQPTVIFEEKASHTAYLKIKNFSSSTKELADIFPEIIDNQNYQNLIIDLRDNGGGGIEAAFEFAKHIINDEVEVGYFVTNKLNYNGFEEPLFKSLPFFQPKTTDEFIDELKNGKGVKLVFQESQNKIFSGKIYVLTNKKTASTCEPIVYVLKNLKKATVVGETTAGAMLSAAPFEIEGKYKLVLPIADFYTYDGFRLDQTGVKPNIEVKSDDALNKVIDLIENK